ncbi:MAG: ATP-binding protein [Candidatus Fibromonas sp.]|jgi:predicted AAA+ superfamily ATPase|nr:ATP-binding protein [Candidatus Fibromonas sp.]
MISVIRQKYVNFLLRSKDRQIIKVVSGVRRCGKSTLFSLYKNHLLRHGVLKEQIIDFNFEDMENESIGDYKKLYSTIKKQLLKNKMNYIFLDEIQHVKHFERAIDSLFIHKNVDLYITGSNAYFMSGELATLLSGRYIELRMQPFSFAEFLSGYSLFYPDKRLSRQEIFNEYIRNSSFPYTLQIIGNREDVFEYLHGIYATVLLKDVIARSKITDIPMLENIARFVFDSIGSPVSATKISNYMKSNGKKTDVKTVEKYLRGLTDSLILYYAERYNIKGKQYLSTLGKYYSVDIGLRNMLVGSKGGIGHIVENIVYLELLHRGYRVSVGVIDNFEVDFVANRHDETIYVQVSATVRDEQTLARELRPLQMIKDNFQKYLITLDKDPKMQHNGILQVNLSEWLLE